MTKQEMIDFIEMSQADRKIKYQIMSDELDINAKALNKEQVDLGWCSQIISLDPK